LTDDGNLVPDAFKEVVKKIGSKIVAGQLKDLLKVSAPAKFHYNATHLQLNAHGTCLCATHLTNAANTEDPLERMKWVLGYYIGG